MLAALPTPSIASLSFSLALLTKSTTPFSVISPPMTKPTGPKNLTIIFPNDKRFGSSFEIPPEKRPVAILVLFVPATVVNSPAFSPRSVASLSIPLCVNKLVTACKANIAVVTLNIIPDMSPNLPPDIDAIPARDDIAKEELIKPLSNDFSLSFIDFIFFAVSFTPEDICGLIGMVDSKSFNFIAFCVCLLIDLSIDVTGAPGP